VRPPVAKRAERPCMWTRIRSLSMILSYAAAGVLLCMMLLTTVDVGGRYLFKTPITGVFELTEFMMVCVVFLALAFTQSRKGHIEVDLIVRRFPKTVQRAVSVVNNLFTFLILTLIAWKSFERALEVLRLEEVSGTLSIPVYPFVFVVSLGAAVMALEILRDLVETGGRGHYDA